MKTTNAIFVLTAVAAFLVAPANAGITTNVVSGDQAVATARLSTVPASWPALTLAVNSGTPFSTPAAGGTNISTDTRTCAVEACCEETTSPGHYSISQTGGLAKATTVERTRHVVEFFSGDAAISIGGSSGNAGWSYNATFDHFPSAVNAGTTRQPHGVRLLSWSW